MLSIKTLAKNENYEITQSETSWNYAIGIDETKSFVFFQSKNMEVVKYEIIDLAIEKESRFCTYSILKVKLKKVKHVYCVKEIVLINL